MPSSQRFQAELAAIRGRPFADRCFRVVALESFLSARNPILLFDLGPRIAGQRFSPPDEHRGLYVSTGLETAGSEFAGGQSAWVRGDCTKHIVFDIEVNLNAMLDLPDAAIRKRLRTTKKEMKSAWLGYAEINDGAWPPTWLLGHAVFTDGRFDGLLYPSTKHPTGICLLVFTERLVPGKSHVIIYRNDRTVWERLP